MTPTSRVGLAVALIGACGAASCASPPEGEVARASGADARVTTIEGALTYRERIALRPGSTATVGVVDHAVADRAAPPLAERTIDLDGRSVPVAFELAVPRPGANGRGRYGVRAVIEGADGALLWTTDTFVPVDLAGGAADVGQLVLVRAGGVRRGGSR